MAYFFEHGKFPAEEIEYAKKNRSLVVTILWNILLGVPLWYILSVLLSGSITSLLIAATIVLVGK